MARNKKKKLTKREQLMASIIYQALPGTPNDPEGGSIVKTRLNDNVPFIYDYVGGRNNEEYHPDGSRPNFLQYRTREFLNYNQYLRDRKKYFGN